MEKFLVNSIQEIFLFDMMEMIILLCFYLIETKKKISKIQFIYNLGILTIFDFVISALNLPIIMQISFIIIVALYLQKFFQVSFIKNIKILIKVFVLTLIEMPYVIIFNILFNIQIISMPDTFLKFVYGLPCRILEGIIIYLYYKHLKEVKIYEKR